MRGLSESGGAVVAVRDLHTDVLETGGFKGRLPQTTRVSTILFYQKVTIFIVRVSNDGVVGCDSKDNQTVSPSPFRVTLSALGSLDVATLLVAVVLRVAP